MTNYMTNDSDLTTVANAIRAKGGTSSALVFPSGFADAIGALPSQPSGNLAITDTASHDVSAYATAQVVDADLVAGNIKKDVNVLGVVGTYEGGGLPSFMSVCTHFTVTGDGQKAHNRKINHNLGVVPTSGIMCSRTTDTTPFAMNSCYRILYALSGGITTSKTYDSGSTYVNSSGAWAQGGSGITSVTSTDFTINTVSGAVLTDGAIYDVWLWA